MRRQVFGRWRERFLRLPAKLTTPDLILLDAVQSNVESLVRALLRRGIPADTRTANGETALAYAARFGNMGIISLLLAHGADPNAADNDGYTAILSPLGVDYKTARILLLHGAKADARTHGGDTAIHGVAGQGDLATLNLLLDAGADLDTANDRGATPLIDSAKGRDAKRVHVAERLLEAGANLYTRDADGRTAFLWATRFGNPHLTRFLLSRGANPDDRDNDGNTALSYMETQLDWARTYEVIDFLETYRFLSEGDA